VAEPRSVVNASPLICRHPLPARVCELPLEPAKRLAILALEERGSALRPTRRRRRPIDPPAAHRRLSPIPGMAAEGFRGATRTRPPNSIRARGSAPCTPWPVEAAGPAGKHGKPAGTVIRLGTADGPPASRTFPANSIAPAGGGEFTYSSSEVKKRGAEAALAPEPSRAAAPDAIRCHRLLRALVALELAGSAADAAATDDSIACVGAAARGPSLQRWRRRGRYTVAGRRKRRPTRRSPNS
jgi:hypothetical protein